MGVVVDTSPVLPRGPDAGEDEGSDDSMSSETLFNYLFQDPSNPDPEPPCDASDSDTSDRSDASDTSSSHWGDSGVIQASSVVTEQAATVPSGLRRGYAFCVESNASALSSGFPGIHPGRAHLSVPPSGDSDADSDADSDGMED